MDTLKLIYEVIDELNLELEENARLEKSVDAKIFGQGSVLDSMGLINFITLIEEKIEEETGKFISIADERAMSLESSPFQSVSSLKAYIDVLLDE
jgi:hypothetical protein